MWEEYQRIESRKQVDQTSRMYRPGNKKKRVARGRESAVSWKIDLAYVLAVQDQ